MVMPIPPAVPEIEFFTVRLITDWSADILGA